MVCSPMSCIRYGIQSVQDLEICSCGENVNIWKAMVSSIVCLRPSLSSYRIVRSGLIDTPDNSRACFVGEKS